MSLSVNISSLLLLMAFLYTVHFIFKSRVFVKLFIKVKLTNPKIKFTWWNRLVQRRRKRFGVRFWNFYFFKPFRLSLTTENIVIKNERNSSRRNIISSSRRQLFITKRFKVALLEINCLLKMFTYLSFGDCTILSPVCLLTGLSIYW